MTAGRPQNVDDGTLYALAHHFYWELKTVQEGFHKIIVDRKKHALLMQELEITSKLNAEAMARLKQGIDRNIQVGNIPENERESRLLEMKEEIEFHRKFTGSNSAIEVSQKRVRVPGDSDVIDDLLNAKTPDRIREICADAFITRRVESEPGNVLEFQMPNWPISSLSRLPSSLSQYASEFIEAKNDLRFPKSGRPTSRLKQLWFLSRALAGIAHGLSVRTAINRLGSVRPDEGTMLSKLSKRSRRRKKATRKRS
jgi:hypothetical protein